MCIRDRNRDRDRDYYRSRDGDRERDIDRDNRKRRQSPGVDSTHDSDLDRESRRRRHDGNYFPSNSERSWTASESGRRSEQNKPSQQQQENTPAWSTFYTGRHHLQENTTAWSRIYTGSVGSTKYGCSQSVGSDTGTDVDASVAREARQSSLQKQQEKADVRIAIRQFQDEHRKRKKIQFYCAESVDAEREKFAQIVQVQTYMAKVMVEMQGDIEREYFDKIYVQKAHQLITVIQHRKRQILYN